MLFSELKSKYEKAKNKYTFIDKHFKNNKYDKYNLWLFIISNNLPENILIPEMIKSRVICESSRYDYNTLFDDIGYDFYSLDRFDECEHIEDCIKFASMYYTDLFEKPVFETHEYSTTNDCDQQIDCYYIEMFDKLNIAVKYIVKYTSTSTLKTLLSRRGRLDVLLYIKNELESREC